MADVKIVITAEYRWVEDMGSCENCINCDDMIFYIGHKLICEFISPIKSVFDTEIHLCQSCFDAYKDKI